jgi:hypothetical protein
VFTVVSSAGQSDSNLYDIVMLGVFDVFNILNIDCNPGRSLDFDLNFVIDAFSMVLDENSIVLDAESRGVSGSVILAK